MFNSIILLKSSNLFSHKIGGPLLKSMTFLNEPSIFEVSESSNRCKNFNCKKVKADQFEKKIKNIKKLFIY